MNKIVLLDKNAEKTIKKFPKQVRTSLYSQIRVLRENGNLKYPHAKKIDKDLFEIRIKEKNIYRAFYAYIQIKHIIILHAFQKKTQKTPLKEIKVAKRRLRQYE